MTVYVKVGSMEFTKLFSSEHVAQMEYGKKKQAQYKQYRRSKFQSHHPTNRRAHQKMVRNRFIGSEWDRKSFTTELPPTGQKHSQHIEEWTE